MAGDGGEFGEISIYKAAAFPKEPATIMRFQGSPGRPENGGGSISVSNSADVMTQEWTVKLLTGYGDDATSVTLDVPTETGEVVLPFEFKNVPLTEPDPLLDPRRSTP